MPDEIQGTEKDAETDDVEFGEARFSPAETERREYTAEYLAQRKSEREAKIVADVFAGHKNVSKTHGVVSSLFEGGFVEVFKIDTARYGGMLGPRTDIVVEEGSDDITLRSSDGNSRIAGDDEGMQGIKVPKPGEGLAKNFTPMPPPEKIELNPVDENGQPIEPSEGTEMAPVFIPRPRSMEQALTYEATTGTQEIRDAIEAGLCETDSPDMAAMADLHNRMARTISTAGDYESRKEAFRDISNKEMRSDVPSQLISTTRHRNVESYIPVRATAVELPGPALDVFKQLMGIVGAAR